MALLQNAKEELGNAARGSGMSARSPSLDGIPRSQVIGWAMTKGRLDVKSAPWRGNNPPVPLGGDEIAPCPVAWSAVS